MKKKKIMTEKIPTTYNSFDNIQLAILIEVVGLIIPKSTKYEVPGADDPKIFSKILNLCEKKQKFISQHLNTIEKTSRAQYKKPFVEADFEIKTNILNSLGRDSQFFSFLIKTVVQFYYQDDRVLKSLDIAARPPYPLGHEVEQGDLSLLEPVRARGEIFRKVS